MTDALLVGSGYGRRVGLRVGNDSVDAVRQYLPFWWVDEDGAPEHVWTVPAAEAAEAAEPTIRAMELWIAEHAVGVVFVHAGVVAVNGRGLLLPGRSMAGKTTLVAALLRVGADYLSDEYAVLTPDGLVRPYPRPLRLRTDDGWEVRSAADFGAQLHVGPCPVGLVATLRFADRWDVGPVSRASAVLDLLDNTVPAQHSPEASLDAVTAAVADARTVAGSRGPADLAAGLLADLFRDDPA